MPFTYGTTLTYVADTDHDFHAMQEAYDGGLPQVDPGALAGLNAASFTDLSIVEFKKIESGRDRGKLLIVVKAQPVGREYPEQATFRVLINRGSDGTVKRGAFSWRPGGSAGRGRTDIKQNFDQRYG